MANAFESVVDGTLDTLTEVPEPTPLNLPGVVLLVIRASGPRRTLLRRAALLIGMAVAVAMPAAADPIRIVSGRGEMFAIEEDGTLMLRGHGLEVGASMLATISPCNVTPCAIGAVVDLSHTVILNPHPGMIGGRSVSQVSGSLSLAIRPLHTARGLVFAPFEAAGDLVASDGTRELARASVEGRGTVGAEFVEAGDELLLGLVTYRFDSAAPTPEPSSVVLVLGALLGGIRRYWKIANVAPARRTLARDER